MSELASDINANARNLDTVVIPVAGVGTRHLPATAGVPKFMLHVSEGDLSRPNIDYTLADCVGAGIKNIIFITSGSGEQHLRTFLGPMDPDLQQQYRDLGKEKQLEDELARRAVFNEINLMYVEQTAGKYGTAIPLMLARPALAELGVKHFAVYGGDDFIWHRDGTSELGLMVDTWRKAGTPHAIMGNPVSPDEASRYGILRVGEDGNLVEIDEKPPRERVPANPLANISRYILEGEAIWPHLEKYLTSELAPGQKEYYITDVINAVVADDHEATVHPAQGVYLDAGSSRSLLRASIYLTDEVDQN